MAPRKRWSGVAVPLVLLLGSGSAGAFELENLVDKNQDKAHKRLTEKGYERVHTDTRKKRQSELWWNAGQKICVELEVELKGKVHRVKQAKKVNKKTCKKEL